MVGKLIKPTVFDLRWSLALCATQDRFETPKDGKDVKSDLLQGC